MKYYNKKQVHLSFEEVLEKTKLELSREGFGVLTEINVKDILKKKLDKDYGKYVILGACNPSLAYQALVAEKDVGLLLPCNAAVYEDDEKIFVSIIMPSVAMKFVQNELLSTVAKEVDEKLKKVFEAI